MFSSVLKILIFVRPKKQLRKHRDVIQTTFLLSLAYTRWLCRRMRQRKVPKKDYLLGLGRFINHTSVAIITAIFSPYYFWWCGWFIYFLLASGALHAMGRLSKNPVACEDRLLVSEDAASNLLSLAAQIALEVEFITGLIARFCTPVLQFRSDWVIITFPSLMMI